MTTLTVQPANKDTYIWSASNTNYSTQPYLLVKTGGGDTKYSLLEFSLSGLPSGVTITGATLYLYGAAAYERTITVYRLLRSDWVEAEATWNSYKSGSVWSTAGAGGAGTDYTTSDAASSSCPVTTEDWQTWDVKSMVEAAIAASHNAMFKITINTNTEVTYRSSNHATNNTRPKLVIEYSAAPTVTTSAATSVTVSGCQGNGEITATGGENCTRRGFCYKAGTSGDPTTADSVVYDDGDYGTGTFNKVITGLSAGTAYRVRAYAVNSTGTGYGTTVTVETLAIINAILSINVLAEATADGIAPADIIEEQGITLTIDALAEALAEGIIPSNITAGTGVTLSVDVLAEAAAAGIPCIFAGYWDLPHKLKLTASNNRTLVLKASNNRDLVLKAENNRTLVLKARD